MRKKVKDTSVQAYDEIKNDLCERRRDVYSAIIKLGECCDLDVAQWLDWPINRVTGRRWELEDAGLVESIGKRLSPHTGRTVHFWRAVPADKVTTKTK